MAGDASADVNNKGGEDCYFEKRVARDQIGISPLWLAWRAVGVGAARFGDRDVSNKGARGWGE